MVFTGLLCLYSVHSSFKPPAYCEPVPSPDKQLNGLRQ